MFSILCLLCSKPALALSRMFSIFPAGYSEPHRQEVAGFPLVSFFRKEEINRRISQAPFKAFVLKFPEPDFAQNRRHWTSPSLTFLAPLHECN